MTDELMAVLEQVRHDIVQLIAEAGATPHHVKVRAGDVVVEIEWGDAPAPAVPAAVEAPTSTAVTAPAVGVFRPVPEPAVRVGDAVKPGQRVGTVEAMNVPVPVETDRAGTVVAVLRGDGDRVEYGEPLFLIEDA